MTKATHTLVSHTPGPWVAIADKSGTRRYRIQQEPYGVLAYVVVGNPANPRVNTDADASLIAAAPDLLAACEGVIHHNNALKERYKLSPSLIRQVEAAIASARGTK